MAVLPFPLVQGFAHDHSSLDVKLDGVSTLGVKSIEWDDSLTPGKVFGTAAQKMAETRGQYDGNSALELWKQEATELEKRLVAAHPNIGLYEIRFPIDVIILSEGGSDQTLVNIVSAKINKRAFSSAPGSDGLAYKYDMSVMYILVDGINPITGLRR